MLVTNASGVTGAAAALSARIQASGWDMLPPGNATSDVTTSSVYYMPGFEASAASIASSLSLPATAVVPYTERGTRDLGRYGQGHRGRRSRSEQQFGDDHYRRLTGNIGRRARGARRVAFPLSRLR